MAITKLLSITTRVDNRIKYIGKSEKIGSAALLSSYNCSTDRADFDFDCTASLAKQTPYTSNSGKRNILAYHLVQSFSPNDNITPEEAHEIGKQLADQLLGGRYEYVIATHTDKKNIHNHIIFNSVSFMNFQKLATQPFKTAQRIRSTTEDWSINHVYTHFCQRFDSELYADNPDIPFVRMRLLSMIAVMAASHSE